MVWLRPMTQDDLPLLHEWLNRPHIVQWWGGEQPSLDQVRQEYSPRALMQQNVTPYIGMLDASPQNVRAIRCYEKAGFRRVNIIDTPDGPALYMVQDRPAAAP